MKNSLCSCLIMAVAALQAASGATTFTHDTVIGVDSTAFDGQEIAVSNCTLTVDGPHSFGGLQVLPGGKVTHTFTTNGALPKLYFLTNEVHVIGVSEPAMLLWQGALADSVVVRDAPRLVTYTNVLDYRVSINSNQVGYIELVPGSAITNGSSISVDYTAEQNIQTSVTLTITGNVTVAAGGSIDVGGKGFPGGQGPGKGGSAGNPASGCGGGHGGIGGLGEGGGTAGLVYDPVTLPNTKGSGGGAGAGPGGSGGGRVKLVVTGTVWVDGVISADGAVGLSSLSGGGSGGSIWITAQTLGGAGLISANGGPGAGGRGGGGGAGRILLEAGQNMFSGVLSARGGSGYNGGGPGSILTKPVGTAGGELVFDNGGQTGGSVLQATLAGFNLSVRRGSRVELEASVSLGALEVGSDAWLEVTAPQLTVAGNATIAAGGGMIADGLGYGGNSGQGAGSLASYDTFGGGGGAYGGFGGQGGNGERAFGGNPYGNSRSPVDKGSGGGSFPWGGPGSAGGGSIRMDVGGLLLVNGRISADGEPGLADGAGGGSGGSIWLTARTVSGTGEIQANGGDGNGFGPFAGGGGGGGRISIQSDNDFFFGAITAAGGDGYVGGGAGTVYLAGRNDNSGLLLADNAGKVGANTGWGLLGAGTVSLKLMRGAASPIPALTTIANLFVGETCRIYANPNEYNTISVTGNAIVEAGAAVIADGVGHERAIGFPLAAGKDVPVPGGYTAGGGGHGGTGGSGVGSTNVTGGYTHGSVTSPVTWGGTGGANSAFKAAGGRAVRLIITGTLRLDGTISANGVTATNAGSGGGAGGSVWISSGEFSGAGVISANGGAGVGSGGGGGGGRISIDYGTNLFGGTITARGGSGGACGGAGTVYSKGRTQGTGLLVLDNGGATGPSTWLPLTSLDLVVRGGAAVASGPTMSLNSLFLGSNSWIIASNSGPITFTISSNATIEEGGAILGDESGYAANLGQGKGGYSPTTKTGGGGGYGGYGGSWKGDSGGYAYGRVESPLERGSGGGSSSSTGAGAGGAAIRVIVNGTLALNGRISADGGDAVGTGSGGGAGGSIWLSPGSLTGRGVISANGGAGLLGGGGGGGGRIAIDSDVSSFGGAITAFGGPGQGGGGAGTIYFKEQYPKMAQLLVDNNGLNGTNTSWSTASAIDLTVRGGAIAAPPAGQGFGNLVIASNGWVYASNQVIPIGDAVIEPGGGIVADGSGFAPAQGPGAGMSYFVPYAGNVSGGGGHGGYGTDASVSPLARGGNVNGVIRNPTLQGSGGGHPDYGGSGGGALRLQVTRSLIVNGRISANGAPGRAPGGGGGAGGSVWIVAGTLAGTGSISANGGAANGGGGGGGGGRIALEYNAGAFSGTLSAHGGKGGAIWGGAGTIYARANLPRISELLIDNSGFPGTNTLLLLPGEQFSLTIGHGAVVSPTGPTLVVSNLVVRSGSVFTTAENIKNLDLVIQGKALVETGGAIRLDGNGYPAMSGPGAGLSMNAIGSGAGHGGQGGASPLQPGGMVYGAAETPVDPGSGGGYGALYGPPAGSAGAGAIRLTVNKEFILNGSLTAYGTDAFWYDAGGGSGGSIWINAGVFAGTGVVAAAGGNGDFYGGGGGGGRIAIYSPLDLFTGKVSVSGGDGFGPGEAGTVFYGTTQPPLQVLAQSPLGAITQTVSTVEIAFNAPLDFNSIPASAVVMHGPGGIIPEAVVSPEGASGLQITFAPQSAEGAYTVAVGPGITDLQGRVMSQVYTGAFSVCWPVIHGRVRGTNNEPVGGALIQAEGGSVSTTSDAEGRYQLKIAPGSSVVPSKAGMVFVPSSRCYVDGMPSVSNQDYLAVNSVTPSLSSRVVGTNLVLSWPGLPGVNYQPLWSTNLLDWIPYEESLACTNLNESMQLVLPIDGSPQKFCRVAAEY